jgi:hypothetical protein
MTSDIHDHYVVNLVSGARGKTQERRLCCHCDQSYATSTSLTILRQHIDAKHSGTSPPHSLSISSSSSSPPLKRQRTVQSTLHSTLFIDNAALRSSMSALFARCSWAHHIANFPEFIDFVAAARSSNCAPPDRRQLRLGQAELAQSLRARVVRQLRCFCRTSPLTVAVDGWTNVNTSKVTNVVILCGGVAYYWCSIVNGLNHNTAAWLHTALVKVLDGIKAEGLMFTALVADNERVNRTLWELLLAPFPFLIRSPCAAHLIQLCVNKALELPHIDPLFTSMEVLLRRFRLKEARLKLKNLQVANPLRSTAANSTPVVYALLRPQDTRWSSWLYAAQRLLMLKAYIDMVVAQQASFWSAIEELVQFLKPFQVATDIMQQDRSTLFDVWRQFKRLLTHVRGVPPSSLFHSSKAAIINIILDLWEKHINIEAVVICAQLSFDSSVDDIFPDKIQDARRWFIDFAAQYALYWHIADSSDADLASVKRSALREWSNFLGRTQGTCFDRVDSDIEDLKEHSDTPAAFARAVWNLYLADAPIISHAAVAILSVTGSEAAVERTFSAQGLVHSDLRNRLGDTTVENEMFIKFNQRTLAGVEGSQPKQRKAPPTGDGIALGHCAEMGEDYDSEEDDTLPSVVGLFTRPEAEAAQAAAAAVDEAKDSEVVPAVISQVPRPPPADEMAAFIEHVIMEVGVTPVFRWTEARMNRLWTLGQQWNPPMMDTDVVLRKKVMAVVKAREAAKDASSAEV